LDKNLIAIFSCLPKDIEQLLLQKL